MTLHLRFFAAVRERLSEAECLMEVSDGMTVAELLTTLCAARPALEPFAASLSFAVNREYVGRGHHLADGDEVALIPPVSGGCDD